MALGVRTLAMIWDAAWAAGGGKTNAGRIDRDVLRGHYENVNFVRSVTVNEIEQEIAHPTPESGGASAGGAAPKRAPKTKTKAKAKSKKKVAAKKK